MEDSRIARLTIILLLISAISGCSQSQVEVNKTKTDSISAQQGQLEVDPRIVTWLATCQTNGEEPYIQGLLVQATGAKSVRDRVTAKYGDLKALHFCQFFGSPEFGDLVTRTLGKPVTIITEPNSGEALAKNHPPNTVVVYPADDDPYRYSCDLVGPDGKLGSGSSDRIEP
jgi:hypothetical protein